MRQPGQDLLLILENPRVQRRDSVLEVNQGGQVVEPVLLGFVDIVDADEGHTLRVALVVDLLQFGQRRVALLFLSIVCAMIQNIVHASIRVDVLCYSHFFLTEKDGQMLLFGD